MGAMVDRSRFAFPIGRWRAISSASLNSQGNAGSPFLKVPSMKKKLDRTTFYEGVRIRRTGALWFHTVLRATALHLRRTTGRQFGIPRLVQYFGETFASLDKLVVCGPDGQDFVLRASENGFGIVTGGFGVSEIKPLVDRLSRSAVVLDIGANIGVWTRLFASRVTDGCVYAFEPSPQNFETLKENAHGFPNITCVNLVCSDVAGQLRLSVAGSPGLHHITADSDDRSIEVATVRLDDWIFDTAMLARLDVLKVDVEGHEPEVFRGCGKAIRKHRPIVLFEYLPEFKDRSDRGIEFLFDFFAEIGFEVFRLDKSGILHRNMGEDLPPDWTNDFVAFDPVSEGVADIKALIVD